MYRGLKAGIKINPGNTTIESTEKNDKAYYNSASTRPRPLELFDQESPFFSLIKLKLVASRHRLYQSQIVFDECLVVTVAIEIRDS